MKSNDPYKHSSALQRLQKRKTQDLPLRLAFLDIDSTMTLQTPAIATNKIRRLLEEKEFVVSFVTSKTEEIIISEAERKKSLKFGRPVPHLGVDESGNRFYVNPKVTEPFGILDADIVIGSTGSNILVKQKEGGYIADEEYKLPFPMNSHEWRKKVLSVIDSLSHQIPLSINANEYPENYRNRVTDVYPPDYRVEVSFDTSNDKTSFQKELIQKMTESKMEVSVTEDSDPSKKNFTLYIMPYLVSKKDAVDHVIKKISKMLSVPPQKFNTLFAGDSYPDLLMGLYAGAETNATFLVVGKSRLTPYLLDESKNEFAGVDITSLKKETLKNRSIIIGDIAFPNTVGPETILAYLTQLP